MLGDRGCCRRSGGGRAIGECADGGVWGEECEDVRGIEVACVLLVVYAGGEMPRDKIDCIQGSGMLRFIGALYAGYQVSVNQSLYDIC